MHQHETSLADSRDLILAHFGGTHLGGIYLGSTHLLEFRRCRDSSLVDWRSLNWRIWGNLTIPNTRPSHLQHHRGRPSKSSSLHFQCFPKTVRNVEKSMTYSRSKIMGKFCATMRKKLVVQISQLHG